MIDIGTSTDIGKSRAVNEDSLYVSEYVEQYGALYAAVADGMGGHKAGEIASQTAIREVRKYINRYYTDDLTDDNTGRLLEAALLTANKIVYQMSREDESLSGMGTTLTLILKVRSKLFIAHVGDSRAYLIKDQSIRRITTDHSIVEELLRSGQITPLQARNHPQKNVITRALGTDETLLVDVMQTTAESGDIYLLCTDGLSNMVSDSEIMNLTLSSASAQGAAAALTRAALDAGGNDNISVIVLKLA